MEYKVWQEKNDAMDRLEERYRHKVLNDDALADGCNFNFRLRYHLWYEVPFIKNGTETNSW